MSEFTNILKARGEENEIEFSNTQLQQFEIYFNALVEWNQFMNLTAITDMDGVALKHFVDSVIMLKYTDVPKNCKMVDVGTGAGFPSVPLKIMRPDIELTLLDSLNKRLKFLTELCQRLGITCEIVHSRAEDGGALEIYHEKFDMAVSRAVAAMEKLSGYCLPFVKKGGKLVALKGPALSEELEKGKAEIEKNGGKVSKVYEYRLKDAGERTIVEVLKTRSVPIARKGSNKKKKKR